MPSGVYPLSSSAARIPYTARPGNHRMRPQTTRHISDSLSHRQLALTPRRAARRAAPHTASPAPSPPHKLLKPQPQLASTSLSGLSNRKKSNPKAGKDQKNPGAPPSLWAMLRAGGRRLLAPGIRRLAGEGAPGLAAAAAAGARAYHERVVDHYNNPRNVGSFDKDDANVGTGLVGAPACGDVMKLQIRVDEGSGKIVDACFKTFGCGSAIASSSVATEWVKGKQMEEVLTIKNTEIAKHLSLPPVKLHCSMLAEDAIKAAVKDYEAKKAKLGQNGEDGPAEKAAEA